MMKPAIVHVITELGAGGAERMLLRLVTASTRYRHVVVSLSRDGALVPALRDAGAEVLSLGMRRYVPSLRGIFGLVKIIRRERPAVIQTWLYHADLIGLIAAKLTGYPIAWNLRCSNMDLSRYRWSTRIVVQFLVWLSSLPDLVMVNSEAGRRWHTHLGYRAPHWEFVPNGIDPAVFCPNTDARLRWRQRLGVKGSAILVGMVARRDPMKDHEGMLHAAAAAAREQPNLEFVFAGRGITQNDQTLARLAGSVGAPVHLIGECDDPAGLNAALDIAVLSSAFGEGFPNVVAEAMATGVPCVATDVGDAKSVIDRTGLVVPPRSARALAEAIVILAKDQPLRVRLGKAARGRIEQDYDLSAAIARYEAIWHRFCTSAERSGDDPTVRDVEDHIGLGFELEKPALAAVQVNSAPDTSWVAPAYERTGAPGPLKNKSTSAFGGDAVLPSNESGSPRKLTSHRTALLKYAQHGLPVVVTISALAVAFSRFDLNQLWKTAAGLQLSTLAVVLLALTLGNLLACVRLQLLARDLHHPVHFRDAFAATALGQLAGSFFFQVIGQTIARSAVFSKVGVSMPTTIIITGYERVVAAAISLALALIGTFYLFGHITLDLAGGGDELLKILAGIVIVGAAGAILGWGTGAKRALEHVAWVDAITIYFRTSLVSLLIQLTTMAAYIVAATGLVHSVGFINLVAATTLVMFAASIPVSLAGWGLREVSAIYALGAIGVPYSTSLVIALLIGFSSILIMAMLALVSAALTKFAPAKNAQPIRSQAGATHSDFLNWCIPLFVASAVFFQIHVPVGAGLLDVNLADSIVLFGGALFVRQVLSRSARMRPSRVPNSGLMVGLMSLVIVFAFLHGWFVDGWTAWASTNRLFGWLVLLAYVGTGALLAMQNSAESSQVLLRTFVAAGLAVIALELSLLFAVALGADIPLNLLAYRIEGFAQNPNAFGFQLLLVFAAIIALRLSGWRQRIPLTLIYMALYFSASRAAEGTCVVVCVAAVMLGYINWRALLVPFAYAVIGVLAIVSAGHLVVLITNGDHASAAINKYFGYVNRQLTEGDSAYLLNNDRWMSLVGAIKMFLAHPLFGGGLGAFVFAAEKTQGKFLIIHSTPLWLLAETGLVGFLVFAVPYVSVLHREIHGSLKGHADSARILLVLSLLAFGVMSQVHDLMYQRTFWFLIGTAIFGTEPLSRSHANGRSSAARKIISR